MKEVLLTFKEWAKQEKDLVDKFTEEAIKAYGEDVELHPGKIDDIFRHWHDDCEQPKPEET